jgi:hypothetical protein
VTRTVKGNPYHSPILQRLEFSMSEVKCLTQFNEEIAEVLSYEQDNHSLISTLFSRISSIGYFALIRYTNRIYECLGVRLESITTRRFLH